MEFPRIARGLALAAALAFLAAACSKVPYTDRSRLMLVSQEQEVSLGEKAAAQVKAQEPVATDTPEARRVERVGRRVADAVGDSDYQWEFYYIDKDVKNAFALPGGKVFVYKGLLDMMDSDDELAVVLSHEIAHVTARHGAERLSQSLAVQTGAQVAGAFVNFDSALTRELVFSAYGLGAQVGVILPYSRQHEYEADHIGLIYMTRAGYDPDQALAFWRKMAEDQEGDAPSEWLSTHPTDENRIQAIAEALPDIKATHAP